VTQAEGVVGVGQHVSSSLLLKLGVATDNDRVTRLA
jgi:hypothetical protein